MPVEKNTVITIVLTADITDASKISVTIGGTGVAQDSGWTYGSNTITINADKVTGNVIVGLAA